MSDPLLVIGRGTYGHPDIHRFGERARVRIGNYCSIAQGVTILVDADHHTDWVTTFPFQVPGHVTGKGDVFIGHDVWIGYRALILSGVTIGNGAVIGAGAVVARSIPAYAIAAGNPARVVRYRFDEATIAKLERLQWWLWPEDRIRQQIPLLTQPPGPELFHRLD